MAEAGRNEPERALTHEQWTAEFHKRRLELQNDHGVPARRAALRARALTIATWGAQPPGPPGKLRIGLAVLRAGLEVKRGGGIDMKFLKRKAAWKAIRTALTIGGTFAALALLGLVDTTAEIQEFGVSPQIAGLLVMAVGAGITWLRNLIAVKYPEFNLVKKAGSTIMPAQPTAPR